MNAIEQVRLERAFIARRLEAVVTMKAALRLWHRYSGSAQIRITCERKLLIRGTLALFVNPAVEAGLINARTLLEFLGLCLDGDRLSNLRNPRKKDDIGIEKFSNASGALSKVTRDQACSLHPSMKPREIEKALVAVMHVTGKGLAHMTESLKSDPKRADQFYVAAQVVPDLVKHYFYDALGLNVPELPVSEKKRPRRQSSSASATRSQATSK